MAGYTIKQLPIEASPSLRVSGIEFEQGRFGVSRSAYASNLFGKGYGFYQDRNVVTQEIEGGKVQLVNDGAGTGTEKQFLPKRSPNLWDVAVNRLAPAAEGDVYFVYLQFDCVLTGNVSMKLSAEAGSLLLASATLTIPSSTPTLSAALHVPVLQGAMQDGIAFFAHCLVGSAVLSNARFTIARLHAAA